MNTTHIHLLLNHFPIIGSMIGGLILLWGIIKKQDQVKSIAAVVIVVMTLLAIPVFLTGEPAEDAVENLPGVSEAMINLHEEAAELAIWLMVAAGVASLAALFFKWKKSERAKIIFTIALVMSLLSFGAMARTGYYGGKIRHTEISAAADVNQTNGNEKEKQEGSKEKEEEKEKDND